MRLNGRTWTLSGETGDPKPGTMHRHDGIEEPRKRGRRRGSRVISVSGLFVYPVKSCGGVMVEEAVVGVTGFELDRRWMVVGEAVVVLSNKIS